MSDAPARRIEPSLEAVLHPERFEPFPGVTTPDAFGRRWREEPNWVLANLAHAAYHPGAAAEALLRGLGATARSYDLDGAQALLAHWDDEAVVAFRGTQVSEKRPARRGVHVALRYLLRVEVGAEIEALLATDVLADLRFRTVPLGTARVHRGFLGEFDKLWPAIAGDLDALLRDRPDPNLWATGHSLGAALATLAGMHRPLHAVVTFGEPRVGRRIDTEFKAGRHLRVVNGLDPVARIPPRAWPFRYRHHGEVLKIADPVTGPNVLHDHSIILYYQNLAPEGGGP